MDIQDPSAGRHFRPRLIVGTARHHSAQPTGRLNDSRIALEDDGSFRVVLAARNPGVRNWIDTAGHREGQIVVRALLTKEPLEVKFRRVGLHGFA